MPIDIILGLQWGDEGKGKIVDLLSKDYDIIARFQGGPNAGHTIIIGKKKYVLHQIPSGMTRKGVINVVGNGVVLDPNILRKEIESLEGEGIEVKSRLLISRKANLILPTHRLLDAQNEQNPDNKKVGTTLKGIGPTYQDKTGRFGLRIGEIFTKDFLPRYELKKQRHLDMLNRLGVADVVVDDAEWLKNIEYLKQLNFIDCEDYLNEALENNKLILAEGAQGTLLDIDFGTYPYVTSSNTISASVCTGLGVAPQHIRKVFGIFKAYLTRVGEGPFPTELLEEMGEIIRQKGHEFGSTTGRPRRTGWLDLLALKYAITLNGVTDLIMMKLDVLDGITPIGVSTHYYNSDNESCNFSKLSFDHNLTANSIEMQGWSEDTSIITDYDALPETVKDYINYIEQYCNKAIKLISTGPERDQTIIKA
ncbi:MAG: adenylosuccinate synthase [Bacteroidota bacterium]|nr:adenylosuccinate synthase [Bacteroidota bacterium]